MNYKEFTIIANTQIVNFKYNQMTFKYILVCHDIFWMLHAVENINIHYTRDSMYYKGIELLEVTGKDKDFVEVI